MLGRLKELTELNGVSGNEKAVRKYLKEFAINYADEVFTDAMGISTRIRQATENV